LTEMMLGIASQCCESARSREMGLRINTVVQCKEGLVHYQRRMIKYLGLVVSRLILYNHRLWRWTSL